MGSFALSGRETPHFDVMKVPRNGTFRKQKPKILFFCETLSQRAFRRKKEISLNSRVRLASGLDALYAGLLILNHKGSTSA
jgi:hypothetical protein